jgi:hypothetical protein
VKRDQAEELVATLAAAWPTPAMPAITAKLYVDELELLADFELAREVIVGLYRDREATFLPAVGAILGGYHDLRHAKAEGAAQERGLPEAPDRGPIPPEVLAEIERLLGRPFRPFRDMDDAA